MTYVHPEAARVIAGLRKRYEAPTWTLVPQVRSATGCCETIRTADAIAVHMFPNANGWRRHGIEVKTSRADWLREIKRPEKAAPLKLFCSAWYVAVPAPRKDVIWNLDELPERWGLLEVGTGDPIVIVEAAERDAEEPAPGFLCALIRAAAREGQAGEDDGAPRRTITRPGLSRWHVGLECGHVGPKPLAKTMPRTAPCSSCAAGHPTDRELVEAAIEEATEEQLCAYAEAITARVHRAARAG